MILTTRRMLALPRHGVNRKSRRRKVPGACTRPDVSRIGPPESRVIPARLLRFSGVGRHESCRPHRRPCSRTSLPRSRSANFADPHHRFAIWGPRDIRKKCDAEKGAHPAERLRPSSHNHAREKSKPRRRLASDARFRTAVKTAVIYSIALNRAARRDFLRLALFALMMPFLAALSSSDE